jgi:GxxExxY protein
VSDKAEVNRQVAKTANREKDEPGAELDRLAHGAIGAAIEVHRILGPGLLESVYEEALCIELGLVGIPFARQVRMSVEYKRQSVGEARLDLLVGGRLILELKTADGIAPIHVAQLLSYLKVTRLRLGLIINFNVAELRHGIKRVVHTP